MRGADTRARRVDGSFLDLKVYIWRLSIDNIAHCRIVAPPICSGKRAPLSGHRHGTRFRLAFL